MAKTVITKEQHGELNELMQAEYSEASDGAFVLKLDGVPRGFVESTRLDEMRTNNQKLTTANAGLTEKLGTFDGIDPAVARELIDTKDQLDRSALVKAGDLEGLVQAELQKGLAPLQTELETERAARKKSDQIADKAVVDNKVLSAGGDFGKIRKGASSVLVLKAREQGWANVDGTLLQTNAEGEVIGRSINDWVATNAAPGGDLAFIFEASKGGGAEDGEPGPGNTGDTIDSSDRKSFRNNLDDIASGKKQVTPLRRS